MQAIPRELVDGELWIGRNMFQEMGAVRKKTPLDEDWMNVTFQVYDTLLSEAPFHERLDVLSQLVTECKMKWNKVKQTLPIL